MAYAEYADLVAGWHAATPVPSEDAAGEALRRASVYIDAACEEEGVAPDPERARVVCCQVAERALGTAPGFFGATQGSVTEGPFSRSATFSSPGGDLYLTRSERRILGLGRVRVAFVGVARGGRP